MGLGVQRRTAMISSSATREDKPQHLESTYFCELELAEVYSLADPHCKECEENEDCEPGEDCTVSFTRG
jgi:hypothetical protein